MAKVHPEDFLPSSSSSSKSSSSPCSFSYITSEREVFTIWMKSLVMNSNGCTVYDSNGEVVYRIDNYDQKCSDEVYFMDLRGKVLCTITRKVRFMQKFRLLGRLEGLKYSNDSELKEETPWFQVKKYGGILMRGSNSGCNVTVRRREIDQTESYRMERLMGGKLECKITDEQGRVVAEMKQKKSSAGVVLGDDVMTLVVEPNVDHSLIMGLMVVNGLINHKM